MHPAGKGSCLGKVLCSSVFFKIFFFLCLAEKISGEDDGLFLFFLRGNAHFAVTVGLPSSHLRFFLRGPVSSVAFLFLSLANFGLDSANSNFGRIILCSVVWR